MSAGWVRGLLGLAMCWSLPSVVRADVGLVWPACEPGWWERDAVQRVVAVELRASGAAERRGELRFVIDAPCDEAHEVGLTWRDDEGVARRSLDLRDVPEAARARAIALAVAGLVAGPRGASDAEISSASNEAASNDVASNETASSEAASNEAASNEAASNEAASNEAASSDVESPSALPPPVPGDAAASRGEADVEAPDAQDAPDPLARIENDDRSVGDPSAARDAWQLGATLDGAWSTSATPWVGGGIVAGWARGLAAVDLRVGVRFGRERVALGTLVGRWGGATLRGGVDWRRGRTRLGARFGLGVDAIVLFGRSDVSPTVRRLRWTPVAELVGRLAIGRRSRAIVEIGAVVPWLGLRATAPDGAIEVRRVIGVLRVGMDFDVVR